MSKSENQIKFLLNLPPQAKQRARTTENGSYYIPQYKEWLKEAIQFFELEWRHHKPLNEIRKLNIQFYGKTARADIDNLAGAPMDAMVKAGVLRADNVLVIPHLETAWERSRQESIEIILDI